MLNTRIVPVPNLAPTHHDMLYFGLFFHWGNGYNYSGASVVVDLSQCTWTHHTNNLWPHNYNLAKICLTPALILIIQSGHNFAQATIAELLWLVPNYDLNQMLFSMQKLLVFRQDLDNKLIKGLWHSTPGLGSAQSQPPHVPQLDCFSFPQQP